MRQVDRPDPDMQPLPPPIRAAAPGPKPIPGRPNWVLDRGVERYVEPVKPAQPAAVLP